jgi:hypothetical protein
MWNSPTKPRAFTASELMSDSVKSPIIKKGEMLRLRSAHRGEAAAIFALPRPLTAKSKKQEDRARIRYETRSCK